MGDYFKDMFILIIPTRFDIKFKITNRLAKPRKNLPPSIVKNRANK